MFVSVARSELNHHASSMLTLRHKTEPERTSMAKSEAVLSTVSRSSPQRMPAGEISSFQMMTSGRAARKRHAALSLLPFNMDRILIRGCHKQHGKTNKSYGGSS